MTTCLHPRGFVSCGGMIGYGGVNKGDEVALTKVAPLKRRTEIWSIFGDDVAVVADGAAAKLRHRFRDPRIILMEETTRKFRDERSESMKQVGTGAQIIEIGRRGSPNIFSTLPSRPSRVQNQRCQYSPFGIPPKLDCMETRLEAVTKKRHGVREDSFKWWIWRDVMVYILVNGREAFRSGVNGTKAEARHL